MPPEPTRQQLSSRLAYSQTVPSFIQKLRNKVEGIADEDGEEDFDEWQASSGRPPIPQRPAIPERPEDDPGSADEDDDDEKPQVVVLKQGKHMSALEAENEKRKAKGLPPRAEPSEADITVDAASGAGAVTKEPEKSKLSFASSGSGSKAGLKKRKAVGSIADARDAIPASKISHKKAKKADKSLLSFGDGEDG